jgi:hypothetical protein
VGINRFGKPNAVFESEGFIGEGTYRTNINHVAAEVVVNGILDVGADFGVIASVNNTVYTLVG